MKKKVKIQIPSDVWEPLYERTNYLGIDVHNAVSSFFLALTYGSWYERACQRWYGDNIESHIRRV